MENGTTTAALTIGIDLGDRTSEMCVLDRDGRVVARRRMRNAPPDLSVERGVLRATGQAPTPRIGGLWNVPPKARSEAPSRSRYGEAPPSMKGHPAPRISQRSMSSTSGTTPSSSMMRISCARPS